jgi:hypothetical protein
VSLRQLGTGYDSDVLGSEKHGNLYLNEEYFGQEVL